MASPELPLDIIFDILLLLPVKSLLRFKSVSKSWLSLISSPFFIKTHSFSTNRTRLIFSNRSGGLDPLELSQCSLASALCGIDTRATNLEIPNELRTQLPIRVVGSCNGLLCIVTRREWVGIWNPYMRKCKMLPFKQGSTSLLEPQVHQGFCKYNLGFGYDELKRDYKVLKFYYCPTTEFTRAHLTFMIYSTKRNSWRRMEEDCDHVSMWAILQRGTFSNGKIYWTIYSGTVKILTFDLANEKCGEIQVPEFSSSSVLRNWSLGVSGEGCLFLGCGHGNNGVKMDFWMMKEYEAGQSWNKVASIRLSYPLNSFWCTPVFISKNAEILLQFWEAFWLYNPAGLSRKLPINPTIYGNQSLIQVDIYQESLVWLDGAGEIAND